MSNVSSKKKSPRADSYISCNQLSLARWFTPLLGKKPNRSFLFCFPFYSCGLEVLHHVLLTLTAAQVLPVFINHPMISPEVDVPQVQLDLLFQHQTQNLRSEPWP